MGNTNKPSSRKLRGYAFDPSLSLKMDTVNLNRILYKVIWEDLKLSATEQEKMNADPDYEPQGPGPIGEYVEVIDYDPTVQKFYTPVDLNDLYIAAQEGLAPSESNPMFHQQMVYAVAMTTIQNFENALGRKVIWSPVRVSNELIYEKYVQRLRIYPHALREANAYYSPQKKALLFGYFSSSPASDVMQMPDSLVFTCLSHDIIAHETTHAILDGMYQHYNEPTNLDVLAFHEAFADIVALFQHFTFPEVLRNQIAKTRGDLASQNLLGQLAQQFGIAIGSYGSLRDAIGEIDPKTREWKPKEPNSEDYKNVTEPHGRGSILVAAVFEAFINIYKHRVADLLRIASDGTGVLQEGELLPDLVNRLANEAAKAAGHVLKMCIRALDYCPPVDITFGEYLRAIITADVDLVADDNLNYRLAFIDAFRRRGIYPQGIKTLSEESLTYTVEPFVSPDTQQLMQIISRFLREYRNAIIYENDRKRIYQISKDYVGGNDHEGIKGLHSRIFFKFEDSQEYEKLTGLVFNNRWSEFGVRSSNVYGDGNIGPSFQVKNLRFVSRVGPNGNQINQIVFSMVQRNGVAVTDNGIVYFDPTKKEDYPEGGFEFRGGCTLIFDLDTLNLKYAISKPLLDKKRIEGQNNFRKQRELNVPEFAAYFNLGIDSFFNEPFALLHQY